MVTRVFLALVQLNLKVRLVQQFLNESRGLSCTILITYFALNDAHDTGHKNEDKNSVQRDVVL